MRRSIRKSLTMGFSFLAAGAFFSSCDQEQDIAPKAEISEEVKAQFSTLGFDASDITIDNRTDLLAGDRSGDFVLEGDIRMSMENLQQTLESQLFHTGPNGEQYRTNNLVSQGRTINVIGYTANNANGLDSKTQTALQWAVNNFNRLNTGLTFTLTFGSANYASYDMVVYRVEGGGGGSAGFPSNGRPNQYIRINSGTSAYDTNVVEHVITHEMGHSVGLRHTDYFDRSYSCGSGGNEGDGGVGAINIPGTPTGIDPNSIMLACFSANEDGEFGSFDVTALEYLY